MPDAQEKQILRHHRRAHRNYIKHTQPATAEPEHWRSAKAVDLVAFNAGAEARFITWLADRITRSEDHALAAGWVISNAAYELDVSPATIKRYLMKFTADAAPFASNGKFITLRPQSTKPCYAKVTAQEEGSHE